MLKDQGKFLENEKLENVQQISQLPELIQICVRIVGDSCVK